MTKHCIDSCNDVLCLLVNVVLMLIEKQVKFKNFWCKLKNSFALETELYWKISVWKNSKFIWHSYQTFAFFIFVLTGKGNDIPEGLFVSSHSHKIFIEFSFIWFWQHFNIKKYLKSFKVLFLFFAIFLLLMYIF